MWNLLAVEDESIVRVGLRYMIEWEQFGIRWKAEASNGEEALRLLDADDIHIVMTDIRMPGMDGLELAKQIKSRKPAVQIIFLSSYDNFSYAKEALRIGAVDYLHKPTMDEDEVSGVLRKVIEILGQSQSVHEKSKPHLNETQKNEYFLSLLDSYTFPNAPYTPELEHAASPDGYRLISFRKRDDAVQDEPDGGHLRFLSILYLIQEYISKDWGGLVFHRDHKEIIWIAPVDSEKRAVQADTEKYLENLREKVLQLLNVALLYSASPMYRRLEELPEAYIQALLRSPLNEQSDNLIVRKSKEFVDKHLLEDITLAKVAAAIHVSSGYLSRVFYKEIGENFSDYIIRNKLEYAQKLLRATNRKVYEIAADIGYSNPHYFSKLFKERVGLTPLEYRNR
ncbi:response regulator transcription factor [Cohnella candidum]|uniref:Response regulator n=1 Tax=Cohnella candidum TaxID=2674991 RepID=A0A3G3JXS0_9BACL|nr:response regulator [Cohnella candidum]AYQ73046.1 response regulator [Cohnella candidum]